MDQLPIECKPFTVASLGSVINSADAISEFCTITGCSPINLASWIKKDSLVSDSGIFLKTRILFPVELAETKACSLPAYIRYYFNGKARRFAIAHKMKQQQVQRWLSGQADIIFYNGSLYRRQFTPGSSLSFIFSALLTSSQRLDVNSWFSSEFHAAGGQVQYIEQQQSDI